MVFIHWFSSGAYDPDVIERDLSHIAALGMNTVGVFLYNTDISSWNFIDFLRRCETHDLRVDFSFRDVMPQLEFQASKVKELIEKNHLDINRTVFTVGDEKQSIYSFQGAEVEVFGKAVKESKSNKIPPAQKVFPTHFS